LLGAAALMLTYTNSSQSALLLVVLALMAFVFLRSLGYVRFDRFAEAAAERKRNKAMLAAVRPLGRGLRQLQRVEEMWPSVIEAAAAVGASAVALRTKTAGEAEDATSPNLSHRFDGAEGSAEMFRSQFPVPSSKRQGCQLELGWTDGRSEIDRDTEIAVDVFCEYLGDALDSAPSLRSVSRLQPGAKPQA
jgi:UDP-GlcNAc:undecaprenyl-phosphate GlcNAc-1-phosphate transferase